MNRHRNLAGLAVTEADPAVAVSANGNFVVAWQSDAGTAIDVYAAVFASDGSVIKSFDSLYVLTFEDGRWGIRGRSSFAP